MYARQILTRIVEMTIYSIKRDFSPQNVSIVRIVTDSSIQDAVKQNWLVTQEASIELANNGPFEWSQNDIALISFLDPITLQQIQSLFFDVFNDFKSINPIIPIYPNLQNITAHAGGGQALATQLNLGINVISVVATAGDSVKLPTNV